MQLKYINPPKSNYTLVPDSILNDLIGDEIVVYCYLCYLCNHDSFNKEFYDLKIYKKYDFGQKKRAKILSSLVKKGYLEVNTNYEKNKGKKVTYSIPKKYRGDCENA